MKLTLAIWRGYKMFWTAALLQLLTISAGDSHQDDSISRSMGSMPMSKGGWRPVIGNSGLQSYSLVGTQNLLPKYRAPLVLGDSFPSSSRPLVTRDAAKLTSIAQSYKPTNVYNPTGVNLNAPVSSYMNPFALSANSFKFAQNLPLESMIIRHPPPPMYGHPHRPMITKYQAQVALNNRFKQNQLQQAMMQQLAANHFHQGGLNLFSGTVKKPYDIYQKPNEGYSKPVEAYAKPVETYSRPSESHKKPDYKVQDNSGSPQTLGNKQLKFPAPGAAPPLYQHQQYTFKDEQFAPVPPSILGSFTSFGHQTVKGRDPTYPTTKHTYLPPAPPAPTKQTIFNSFNYTPAPKPKEHKFPPSTTKSPVTSGNIIYGLADNGFKTITPPAVQYKPVNNHQKESVYNSNKNYPKDNFKPSPQDPLAKPQTQQSLPAPGKAQDFKNSAQKYYYETDSNRKPQDSSTYFPTAPTTTVITHEYDMQSTKAVPESLLAQLPPPYTTTTTFHGNKQKNEIDSNKDKYHSSDVSPPTYVLQDETYVPQSEQQVPDGTPKNVPFRATYEVTENWGTGEENSQPWFNNDSPQSFQSYNTILRPESPPPSPYPTTPTQTTQKKLAASKQPQYDLSTMYSVDSHGNKHADTISQYGNSLYYDTNVESQSMRPVGDEYVAPTVYKKEKYKKPENVRVNSPTSPTYSERVTQPTYDYKPKSKKKYPSVNVEEHATKAYIDLNEDPQITTARYETYKDNKHETQNDLHIETLPTIPPTKHFKRPPTVEGADIERDRYRKRNKNRRRRPPVRVEPYAEEESPKKRQKPTAAATPGDTYTTESVSDAGSLITRPRIRIPIWKKAKPTTPAISTELTNSAQPTVSPTPPTIVTKKKNLHRPRTTTERSFAEETEYATTSQYNYDDPTGKESSIMKIANRQPSVKATTFSYDYNYNETPDYSHKQDEKDTPTSDIAVSTSGNDDNYAKKLLTAENNNKVKNISYVSNAAPLDSRVEPSIQTYSENTFITTPINEDHYNEQKSGKRGNLNVKTEEELNENDPDAEEHNDDVTTLRTDAGNKSIRPRVKGNKYDTNRPRFSVKDYRNRLNQHSTTTTTEKPADNNSAKFRFPSRRLPYISNKEVVSDSKPSGSEREGSTELPRKKFTPKEPRHKSVNSEYSADEGFTTEINLISTRTPIRQRPSTFPSETSENEVTQRVVTRVRGGIRLRPKTTTSTESPADSVGDQSELDISSNVNSYTKRPRKKLKEQSVEKFNKTIDDAPVTTTESVRKFKNEVKEETSSEKQKSETAIMKIAKDEKKHQGVEDSLENASEQSKRVADLTLAASKDYNTPGMFKAVSPNSRRVPNYFTIATDDPILPIEAFFPQLNQKKET